MDGVTICRFAQLFVRTRLFHIVSPRDDLFRCWRVRPNGTPTAQRVFDRLRNAQNHDHRKHAPCCPANRWGGQELVVQRCNCGAQS